MNKVIAINNYSVILFIFSLVLSDIIFFMYRGKEKVKV